MQQQTFNPTMVRLLQDLNAPPLEKPLVFQSHNGAIAAHSSISLSSSTCVFQSHNGAIAASMAFVGTKRRKRFQSHNGAIAAGRYSQPCRREGAFNPTMVRLLLLGNFGKLLVRLHFQSHNGAIAAGSYDQRRRANPTPFNPTMVRLLPLPAQS